MGDNGQYRVGNSDHVGEVQPVRQLPRPLRYWFANGIGGRARRTVVGNHGQPGNVVAGGRSLKRWHPLRSEDMHTYEKPRVSGSRGPNYMGLIAVICLFTLIFATWALMRTNLG
ncbi:MAG: hypothetical protein QOE02_5460 [Rhodospirillaceae bacterium]|jgi:hypothetical protein|nr:hypothetical protein [Rhodospirillaceae bacterium]